MIIYRHNKAMSFCIVIVIVLVFALLAGFIVGELAVHYILGRKNWANYDDMNISITVSDQTTLYAQKYQDENNGHNWVILVHSYGSDHSAMSSCKEYYQEHGFNTLTLDNRAHGASDGKYIGMGYLDQFDIREWINYVISIDPNASIVLHGESMGAAALMMLSSQDDLPDNVKVIIEDSGYKSAEAYLTWKLKQKFHLPAFPLIAITNIASRIVAGYWLSDASAIEAVKESNVPIIFIHGIEDQTVPVTDAYELYESANCEKDIYIIKGAGHGEAMQYDYEQYWNKVISFVAQNSMD